MILKNPDLNLHVQRIQQLSEKEEAVSNIVQRKMSTETGCEKSSVLNFRVSPDPSPVSPEKSGNAIDTKGAALIIEELRSHQKALSDDLNALSKRLQEFESQMNPDTSPDKPAESPKGHGNEPKRVGNDLRSFGIGLYKLLTCSRIMIFLLVVTFALASSAFSPVVTFVVCMVAIIPLAKVLGEATASTRPHFTSH